MLSPQLLAQVRTVAQELPPQTLESVVNTLRTYEEHPSESAKHQIVQKLPHSHWRKDVMVLLELWGKRDNHLSGEAIAAALTVASYSEAEARKDLSLEIVWTGPEGSGIPVRRTEQVLLQLIREAKHDLTIVSFAIYKVPEITQALIEAMNRNVCVKIIAENPEETNSSVPFGVKAGLGAEIANRSQVYVWDRDKRPKDDKGRYGSLHMKCAIADNQQLFITSANLTEYALSLNMEMGVLIHSSQVATSINQHLENLRKQQVLIAKRI